MRVLITGGSGFLGINLVRRLLSAGAAVRSLDIAALDGPERKRVQAITGDIRDRGCVRASMEGVAAVVHCAAALPLHPPALIRSTEVEGTRVLLDEASQAGIARFVFISSTAVYGVPDRSPILETDPLVGVGPYGRAKIAAERLCEAWRRPGRCLAILRPKSFIGPERLGVFSLLFDWALEGRGFPVLGSGGNRYQLLDVEDLCEAVLRCLEGNPRASSDVFNVGAREFATMKDDFQAVLDEAGFGKRIVAIPAAPAILALRVLELLKLSPLYRWVYETAGKESIVSVDKGARVLGIEPRYSNRDALLRNFRWYREHRRQVSRRAGVSHRDHWDQGVLRLAKMFF